MPLEELKDTDNDNLVMKTFEVIFTTCPVADPP